MNFSRHSNLVLVVVLCAVVGVIISRGNSSRASEENTIQDVSSLDRRLSLLEQRFYSVESSLTRLQQYVAAQRPSGSQPSTADHEVRLISEEIQRLTRRMIEIECGMIKLDERTTPASRRNAAGRSEDPCRVNPETRVQLSARP